MGTRQDNVADRDQLGASGNPGSGDGDAAWNQSTGAYCLRKRTIQCWGTGLVYGTWQLADLFSAPLPQ